MINRVYRRAARAGAPTKNAAGEKHKLAFLFPFQRSVFPTSSSAGSPTKSESGETHTLASFFPFPRTRFPYQQRRHQIPSPIKPAARKNHQNSDGRIRASKMKRPRPIAAKPHRPQRPLRTANRPPHSVFPYTICGGRLFYTEIRSISPKPFVNGSCADEAEPPQIREKRGAAPSKLGACSFGRKRTCQ